MAKKHRQRLTSKKIRLQANHSWKAPKGYKIVVLDRGAVSFNVPQSWIVAKTDPFEVHDCEPPDDNVRLSVSFWRLPPGVDWSRLPQDRLLADAASGDSGTLEILERSEVVVMERADLEVAWTSHRFMDPEEHREAYSRITAARGWNVQALLSFDYWATDAEKFLPVWEEIIGSLQLGREIDDPTKGAILH